MIDSILPLKSCRKLFYLAVKTRYDFQESIVEGYNEDVRAEVSGVEVNR